MSGPTGSQAVGRTIAVSRVTQTGGPPRSAQPDIIDAGLRTGCLKTEPPRSAGVRDFQVTGSGSRRNPRPTPWEQGLPLSPVTGRGRRIACGSSDPFSEGP